MKRHCRLFPFNTKNTFCNSQVVGSSFTKYSSVHSVKAVHSFDDCHTAVNAGSPVPVDSLRLAFKCNSYEDSNQAAETSQPALQMFSYILHVFGSTDREVT